MPLLTGEKIFGLDISDRSLKLVQLAKNGKKISIESYNTIAVPEQIIINGEIKNQEKLVELIRQLLKTANGKKIKTKNVISVLPETKTFIKVITVAQPTKKGKRVKKEELAGLVTEEIKNHIPLGLEEIYLDWQILSQTGDTVTVLVGAVPKETSNSYYTTLEKSGLLPLVFEIEATAIVRSLIVSNQHIEKKPGATMIIDFGAARTGLIIYDKNAVEFTVSVPISGNEITKLVATTLGIQEEEAEKSKIVCGLDPAKCEGALLKVLLTPIENLAGQITKAIEFYKSNFPNGNPVDLLMLCGGGANFLNLDNILKEKVGLPVIISDPLIKITPSKKNQLTRDMSRSYTTAIGLALLPLENDMTL